VGLDAPIRSSADIDAMRADDPRESVPFVYETIRILRRELDGRVPLIGFAASPFTLAAYLIEGRGTKNFAHVKQMLFADPALAHRLLDLVTQTTVDYLLAQIDAGAQAIQLFDSWAGILAPREYREFGRRYASRVLEALRDAGVPRIYFALNSAHILDSIAGIDADVIGVDWRTPLNRASEALDERYALQGNLDPCALFSPPAEIRQRAREILRLAEDLPGHIFNLGHGILPETPIEHVEALVRAVHEGVPANDT
jgi:uroporphyrinogen decarboxylase